MNAATHACQEMPLAAEPKPHPITVSAYHRMGKAGILAPGQRTELIDARIIDMSPIGSEHADWVDRLNRFFSKMLPDAITVRAQNPVCLDETNEPEPDIALLRPREQPYREAHPGPADVLLIIEVADTSLQYDRDVKLPLYARHRIPEVWLVDVATNRLHVYREPIEAHYRLHVQPQRDETLTLVALESLSIDLSRLF